MSMNIAFQAIRKIKVVKTGKTETQTNYFKQVIQTPTDITYQIIKSKDPFQAYRDYVLDTCQDYESEIFADDDFWGDEPIGKEMCNDGPEYVRWFDEWLTSVQEAGYEVKAIVL